MVLLAVDVGLRGGAAQFGPDGRLRWYRAQSFTSLQQLRRTAGRLLTAAGADSWLISEGDVSLAAIWERAAMRQNVRVQRVDAHTWRSRLLPAADGARAAAALALAREVIAWSGGVPPATLEPEAAAAILIGLWGAVRLGWLPGIPTPLQARQPTVLDQALVR